MTNKTMYMTPCAYSHLSDSDAIQQAVQAAAEQDVRTVLIPSTKIWQLEKPVRLPSGVTLILDGAQICAEGIAFTNRNADHAETLCLGGEQERLYLFGTNGASIASKNGPQVYFNNVKNYGIFGISFRGGEGIRLLHCRFGKVQQVRFQASRHGIFLGEGCNGNLLEDILAETNEESVLWSAGDTSVWGRSADIYDTTLTRLHAKTQGAPAVAVYAGSVAANNLFIRDVTDRTEQSGTTIQLGKDADKKLVDLSVRGVATSRTAVAVSDKCDNVFLGNLQGSPTSISPHAARVLTEDCPEQIEMPRFCANAIGDFVDANDPQYAGATDSETLQNAIHGAAGKCLVIPRYNARTGGTIWNIEQTLCLPSDTTVILLDAHLQLADFTYCNLFTNAESARNIRLLGIGSATIDSGRFNGLKAKNANTLGFGPITDNALLLFTGVDGLKVENLHMVQNRWYCILCAGCANGYFANLDICAHPKFPDMGGIRIQSGCHHILIENITGLTGEDAVLLSAAAADDQLFCGETTDISNIHIRTARINVNRCHIVNIQAFDGRKIHDILAENLLDSSLAEQKKKPNACVKIGDTNSANLSEIQVRDMSSRSIATVQLGGYSENVTIRNIHSFGTSLNAVRTVPLPELDDYQLTTAAAEVIESQADSRATVKNWTVNGVFFHCQQASSYMRGTATSIITDKKKYVGTAINLINLRAQDFLIKNILADRIGNGVILTGNATVVVQNFQASEIGREAAVCGSNCHLTIDGETVAVKDSQAL